MAIDTISRISLLRLNYINYWEERKINSYNIKEYYFCLDQKNKCIKRIKKLITI